MRPTGWIRPFAVLFPLGAASVFADTIFTVRQTFTVKDVPDSANEVRGWFWMPEDRPEQKVLEFRVVEAPENFKITRDPHYGRSWISADAPADSDKPLPVVTEFKVLRRDVKGMADPTAIRLLGFA